MTRFILAAAFAFVLATLAVAGGSGLCFYESEKVSGLNKMCFYSCASGNAAITVKSHQVCPLTIKR
jgi:hypothetical protein